MIKIRDLFSYTYHFWGCCLRLLVRLDPTNVQRVALLMVAIVARTVVAIYTIARKTYCSVRELVRPSDT